MKLLIDMNLSPRWVTTLGAAGYDAVHWFDIGAPNAPDHAILEHARNHGFVVLTHDLDFGDILAATGGEAPSVVQLRAANVSAEQTAPALLSALANHADALEGGALLTVDLLRSRIRLLPILRLGAKPGDDA